MTRLADLERNWLSPPATCKPMVRWWWFGTASRDEVERELREIAGAGFGGVEIQTIYHVPAAGASMAWLGAEWLDGVEHAVAVAKNLGLQVDMTFGNGWPFGGPHVDADHASTKISGYSMALEAGESVSIPIEDLVADPGQLVGISAVNPDDGMVEDLRPRVQDGVVSWIVPGRGWHVCWSFFQPTGQRVKRAAPGGGGLVLDHLNRDALAIHSRAVLGALSSRFGPAPGRVFGAFFCDSWELQGANWTRGCEDSFKQAFGHDIVPRFPLACPELFGLPAAARDPLVRYDYARHVAELVAREFFESFSITCSKAGTRSRVQPYCAPTDLLLAYGLVDVPEIEGFGPDGIAGMYYANIDPRLASSAAHVYGKEVVSCECFTWLTEHFSTTMDALKREADAIILHGVNRLVFHGYPYSPPGAGVPGIPFYAAVMANHNASWWPHARLLVEHITRTSYLSSQGTHGATFLVYLPYHDAWSGDDECLKALRIVLSEAWCLTSFDYVNDDRLCNAATVDETTGNILLNGHAYHGLVLHRVKHMPLATTRRVAWLVDQGMRLACIENIPCTAPGLAAQRHGHHHEVRATFEQLREHLTELPAMDDVAGWLESTGCKPAITIVDSNPTREHRPALHHLHRRLDDGDVFLLVNRSETEQDVSVHFLSKGMVERWNTRDGTIMIVPSCIDDDGRTVITHVFEAWEATWFIVRHGSNPNPCPDIHSREPRSRVVALDGPWHLSFPSDSGGSIELDVDRLLDWIDNPETRWFSGTATCSTTITLDDAWLAPGARATLHLGTVHEIAVAWLNGSQAGVAWHGTRDLDVTPWIHAGRNTLKIDVTNVDLNRIAGLARNGTPWRPDCFLVNKQYHPFTAETMEPISSGLLGPAWLEITGTMPPRPN